MSTPAKAASGDATSEVLASLPLGDPELLGEGPQLCQELRESSGSSDWLSRIALAPRAAAASLDYHTLRLR